jgi:symplekin
MSLYADEDVELYPAEVPAVPSDPQRALSAALIVNDPIAQAEALLAASSRFEEHPEQLHDAIRHLLPIVALGPDTVLRAWTIDLIALTVGRSALQGNIKLEGGSKEEREKELTTSRARGT